MAKRGLIILVVVWSVFLLAPVFRAQTRKTIQNLGGDNRSFYRLRDDWTAVKKANPDNAQLAFQDLQSDNPQRTPQYFVDLDALLARFPDDLNLRRARIMESMLSGGLVRTVYTQGPTHVGSSRTAKDALTDEQRAALVQAARTGEKQATDDGFFPWIEAMALWNRDEEPSLRALERAARDSKFNDGTLANARAMIALREAQTPLDADEKIAIMSSVLWPHYAKMREMARQVTWSGIAHYRRGDKAGAYRRWRAILEASAAFRRTQNHGPQSTVIGALVAEAMERLVWGNVADELNPPARVKIVGSPAGNGDAAKSAARLRAFVELARRDGQNGIADYAIRENANFEARKLSRATINSLNRLGFESPIVRANLELPWLGRLIFWLSIAGGLALLICLVWRFPRGRRALVWLHRARKSRFSARCGWAHSRWLSGGAPILNCNNSEAIMMMRCPFRRRLHSSVSSIHRE